MAILLVAKASCLSLGLAAWIAGCYCLTSHRLLLAILLVAIGAGVGAVAAVIVFVFASGIEW